MLLYEEMDLVCMYSNRSLEYFRIFIWFTPPLDYYDINYMGLLSNTAFIFRCIVKVLLLLICFLINSITTATTDPNNVGVVCK